MPTTHSIDNFKIISESYISGVPFSSRPTDADMTMSLWDGSHQHGWTDKTANCFFGTSFKSGYVGVLNEVKYFMSRFTKSEYAGKLSFQGSNDFSTWTTIFTVG